MKKLVFIAVAFFTAFLFCGSLHAATSNNLTATDLNGTYAAESLIVQNTDNQDKTGHVAQVPGTATQNASDSINPGISFQAVTDLQTPVNLWLLANVSVQWRLRNTDENHDSALAVGNSFTCFDNNGKSSHLEAEELNPSFE